jgi:hypothetical protein
MKAFFNPLLWIGNVLEFRDEIHDSRKRQEKRRVCLIVVQENSVNEIALN